jgi:hypothetical protein
VASVSPEALGTISILQPISIGNHRLGKDFLSSLTSAAPSSQAYNVAQCYQPQLLAQVCMEPAISKMYSTYTFNFKQQSSTTAVAKHKHNTTHTYTLQFSLETLGFSWFCKSLLHWKGLPWSWKRLA